MTKDMDVYQHHPEESPDYQGLRIQRALRVPPSVRSPYFHKLKKRPHYSVDDYVKGILDGNITILSQAVTLIESSIEAHYEMAQQVIEKCLPYSGNSIRLGITGVPGAGKSTLIDALGMDIVQKGSRLAVLAIDPSSSISKGSILGDKTRMEQLSTHRNAFIRPSPSAGSLGGVARKTRETIILCEAAGFDVIFVETVGVGQSETAVHSMVDFFLLIQLAGTGDELQGIKRGIMEMADGIVINPADYEKFRLLKDGNGQYIAGGPFQGQYGVGGVLQDPPLWGLNTIQTTAIAAGTVLIGAGKAAATVYRKGGIRVETSNADGNDFTKNQFTILAEERLALAVRRPDAFVKLTLGS